ncbi:hypothetical protein DP187_23940 [Enterobacter cloacae]|nr:hypothetical protein DP187_23940 [Enterobacter cloacae]
MNSAKNNTHSRNTDAPTTEELKSRFQARGLPLETDFHDLIDVAECGRRAVGKNPGQTPNPDSGLMLDGTQQLVVKADVARGLAVSGSGVGVNTSAGNGLTVAGNQLKVALGGTPGLELTGTGLQVKADVARGLAVSGSGVGVNIDTTLRLNNNQIGVPDNYVTKTGNSTIKNGSLSFETDNTGVHFYGGSKIVKSSDSNMRWYKPSNNSMPQICDYNGSNPSNIATEQYVVNKINSWGGYAKHKGDLVAFEVSEVDPFVPIDIDFVIGVEVENSDKPGLVSGRVSSFMGGGNIWRCPGILIDINKSNGNVTKIFLLQNYNNNNLAVAFSTPGKVEDSWRHVRWKVRVNGGNYYHVGWGGLGGFKILEEISL